MAEIETWRDTIRRISPPWLQRGTAEAVLYACAIHLDGFTDALVEAVKYRFPGVFGQLYDDQALPRIGRDRRISRGRNESDATYADRLLGWLNAHRTRGGPYALLEQLHTHFAPDNFPIELIYASGRRFSMDAQGVITRDDVSWSPGTGWARWWLFYHHPPFAVTDGLWGDPGEWGDGGVWGSGLSPQDVVDLRLVPINWNAAHTIGHLVLLDEGEAWDTYPPGEWPAQIALGLL